MMATLWRGLLACKLWLFMLQYHYSYCFGQYYHDESDVLDNNMQAVFTRQRNLWDPGSLDLARHLYKSHDDTHKSSTPSPSKLSKDPEITETTLGNNTHLTAIVTWTHFDSKVIFIITCNKVKKYKGRSFCIGESKLYRSMNYGKTFDLELHKFKNDSKLSIVYTSPRDRNIIFALDQMNMILYRSTDEGGNYQTQQLTFSPASVAFHPSLSNYVVIRDANSNLYISSNTGNTWETLQANVRQFFWSKNYKTNDSEMFIEVVSVVNKKLPTKNYSTVLISQEPFSYTQKFDVNLGPIFPNSLIVKKDYIFIQRKTSAGDKRLFVSYKRQLPFEECELPTNKFHTNFHFLDGRKNEVMLAALTKSGETNLHIADTVGKKFLLIMENIEAQWDTDQVIIDIHRINGVPGTLIANQVKKGTMISYDNGGQWTSLKPPDHDVSSKEIACFLPDCKLKLSLYIIDKFIIGWSQITSSKFVPGVIIAQGKLITNSRKSGTFAHGYLSVDGGQNWKQILRGRHIYKLLDHGGLFAGVPITNPFLKQNTNKIDYSCNDGNTWRTALLPNQLSRVVGVAAHPAAKSSMLKIFGSDISTTGKLIWTIWSVNFTASYSYKCLPDNYTTWTIAPRNGIGSCILGKKYVYERRKEDVCCAYGINYQRKTNISTCQCTMDDFECDFGFKRERIGSFCVPTSFASLGPPVNCREGSQYIKSKGFVKIRGDLCKGGIEDDIMPKKMQCPARAPDGISLSVQKYSIALGKSIVITMKQKLGFLGTQYTWDFGDGNKMFNLSFDEGKSQEHRYEKVGTYVISVLASNDAGSFTAKTVMRIIERLSEVFLHVTKPVVANEEAIYTTKVNNTHGKKVENRHGFVHYAWIFEPIKTPVLSLNSSVKHTYTEPGTYEVEVRVFNAISIVPATTSVTVYGDVRVIRLEFSSTLDLLNQGTPQWNELFKQFVTDYLIKTFKIRQETIEVDVSTTLPTIVTLSLVQNTMPQKNVVNELKTTAKPMKPVARSIDDEMHEIVNRVRKKKIVFFLFGNEVRVLKATIIRDKKQEPVKIYHQPGISSRMTYIYIGVPIGFGFLLLVLYCTYRCCKKGRCRCCHRSEKYLQMQDELDGGAIQNFGMSSFEDSNVQLRE